MPGLEKKKQKNLLVLFFCVCVFFFTFIGLLQSSLLFPNLDHCFHICDKLGIGSPSQSTFRFFVFGVLLKVLGETENRRVLIYFGFLWRGVLFLDL